MPWEEIINEIDEIKGKWIMMVVVTPYDCSIWRSIRNLWPLVLTRTNFKVGNDMEVSF